MIYGRRRKNWTNSRLRDLFVKIFEGIFFFGDGRRQIRARYKLGGRNRWSLERPKMDPNIRLSNIDVFYRPFETTVRFPHVMESRKILGAPTGWTGGLIPQTYDDSVLPMPRKASNSLRWSPLPRMAINLLNRAPGVHFLFIIIKLFSRKPIPRCGQDCPRAPDNGIHIHPNWIIYQ